MHVDPVPGLYPKCVCDAQCEFPCWQQAGLVEPGTPCCCAHKDSPNTRGRAPDPRISSKVDGDTPVGPVLDVAGGGLVVDMVITPSALPATDPAEGWNPHECARFNSVSWACYSNEDLTDAENRAFHTGSDMAGTRIAAFVRDMPCLDPHHDERWCSTCNLTQDIANAIEEMK